MSLISEFPARPGPTGSDGSRLRIGMIAPPWFDVPPRAYGGIESVVGDLVNLLVQRGHEVTLVASGQPRSAATRHIAIYEDPPSADLGINVMPEVMAAAAASEALAELDLDLVHDHSVAGPLLAAGRSTPTVVTIHGIATGEQRDYYRRLGRHVNLVAISDAQRRLGGPALNWVGRVYNAIDVGSYPFQGKKGDELLWMGRFSPDKGAHLAIDAARAAGRKIVLAGKLREPSEHDYFERAIAPRLGPDVEYVGEVDAALKRELFARAACFVFPIQWEEPFGLVMVEAMACGTPVVATPRGSVPEIVAHGETGWVVDDLDGLADAIHRAEEIDPAACRARARREFDLPVMVTAYERVYRDVLEGGARPIRRLSKVG